MTFLSLICFQENFAIFNSERLALFRTALFLSLESCIVVGYPPFSV